VLPLPRFDVVLPRTVAEALDVLATRGPSARLLAGGTDLVPNLKHGLLDVDTLVLLKPLRALDAVTAGADGGMRLGALATLSRLAADPAVQRTYPALALALGQIAGPQLRNMGTLGGNLCLDTRCTYYNQTEHWRQALGYCLKRTGTVCHVVPGGTRCVAAVSSDAAPMLTALGATLVAVSATRGERLVAMDAFFVGEGRKNNVIAADEIVTEVRVPAPAPGHFGGYQKLRPRAAIDFPILSVSVVGARDAAGALTAARVVVGALGSKPREVSGVGALVAGRRPSAELFHAVGEAAHRQCRPLTNIPIDPEWRHAMVPVLVRRAFAQALGLPAGPPALVPA